MGRGCFCFKVHHKINETIGSFVNKKHGIVQLVHWEKEQCFCKVTGATMLCQLVSGYKCNTPACPQAKPPNGAPCVPNNTTKDNAPSLFLVKYFWLKAPRRGDTLTRQEKG